MRENIATMGALVVFLSFLLAASIAHAQVGNGTDPPSGSILAQGASITLSDAPSVSDAVAISQSVVTRSIADSLSVGDSASPNKATVTNRQIVDRVSVTENLTRNFHAFRFAFETLPIRDPVAMDGPSQASIADAIQVEDSIEISGAFEPRSQPIISVQLGPSLVFTPGGDGVDDTVEIEFESSASGTYVIQIRDAQGGLISSLSGPMVEGRNSVTWDGTSVSGSVVPDGTYTYSIAAQSEGGIRDPPRGGDGSIVVEGSSVAPVPQPGQTDYLAVIAAIAAAAAGVGLFMFWRRRKELVLYLPVEASEVVGEIRQKYPLAKVEDFIEPAQGGSKLYKGIRIANPGEDDEDWFTEVISKAKKLAGVDSVNVSYRGKVRAI